MERRRLGRTDMEVSVLGFGAAEIGYESAPTATVDSLLNGALDSGLNVIDTAECYDASEELIGQTISSRRDDYYLFTKCGHAAGFNFPDWHPKLIIPSIERSLRLLRTDRVDLVQIHSCPEQILRDGKLTAELRRARDAGKTRYIGYSGDSDAALYAVTCGDFDVLQISVSVADQEAIDRILPLAAQKQLGVIAKRPLANAVWRHQTEPPDPYVRPYWERWRQLNFAYGNTEAVAGVSLRFTTTVPGVHTAIVGTTKPSRWHENVSLLSAGALSDPEYRSIRDRWRTIAQPGWTGQQ